MKKYSIAVCVCAVLFSVGIHGGGMREVSARAPGADENLAILQDIIRENECQAGMAFLGYTYEGAETAEILLSYLHHGYQQKTVPHKHIQKPNIFSYSHLPSCQTCSGLFFSANITDFPIK